MAVSETRSLVFIVDVTAERINKMNCEAILIAHIQPNATKPRAVYFQSPVTD